jgi:WD40 repeat protein
LSWSPDSNLLVSGSLDNSVILWNVQKGKKISMLTDYIKGFPQGVTWDPTNKYIATISSDRFVKSNILIFLNYQNSSFIFSALKLFSYFSYLCCISGYAD